jgi:hypothetical protein
VFVLRVEVDEIEHHAPGELFRADAALRRGQGPRVGRGTPGDHVTLAVGLDDQAQRLAGRTLCALPNPHAAAAKAGHAPGRVRQQ